MRLLAYHFTRVAIMKGPDASQSGEALGTGILGPAMNEGRARRASITTKRRQGSVQV